MPTHDIDQILRKLVEMRGSDLHLKADRPPMFRLSSDLVPSEFPVVTDADMEGIIRKLVGDKGFEKLERDFENDANYYIKDVARFRVNAFKQMGHYGVIMRVIPLKIPTIDEMNLPAVLKDIVNVPQGLILVTGPTGSGKSTTLAAMINELNMSQPLHIITIEDPVEFVYTDAKCTINQRQLGTDVKSLTEALKRALRQDPDVILMGEMRDVETIELATHAAETGHVVFSTLHTNDAKQTLDRIVDTFPPDAHHQIRAVLSMTLQAVISQRLVKKADGTGRVASQEILINSPNVRDLIAAGKVGDIEKAMKEGGFYRMQTFNMSLAKYVKDNIVTEEEALATTTNSNDLKLTLRGISSGAATMETLGAQKKAEDAKKAADDAKKAETKAGGMKISKGY